MNRDTLARRADLAAVGLVLATAVARFLLSLPVDAPWIASDEMLYGISGREFWDSGHLELLGAAAPFYSVYQLWAGLPLALLGDESGILVLKAVQAATVASIPAVVYLWARPHAQSWALMAAGAAAALPALAYSGLIMTEAIFIPAATVALWRIAAALERPTLARQLVCAGAILLAVTIRLQGVVLVPTFFASVAVLAIVERSWLRILRLWPAMLAVTALVGAWLLVGSTVNSSSVLGVYENVASSGYEPRLVFGWIRRQLGDVFLLSAGPPCVAALLLVARSMTRRETAAIRALSAVTVSYGLLLIVQVGVFASRYADRLTERYLVTAVVPIFVCFAVWLARGMPRPQPLTWIVGVALAIPVVLFPVSQVIVPAAAPDSFMAAALRRLLNVTSPSNANIAWAFAAGAAIALTVLVPRRAAPLLALGVVGILVAASLAAQDEVVGLARRDRADFFGGVRTTWIDDRSLPSVVYVFGHDPQWNVVWHTVFWNRSIDEVAAFPGPRFTSVPATMRIHVTRTGELLTSDGRRLVAADVVASRDIELFGVPIAATRRGPHHPGLVLWRTEGGPVISAITRGIPPSGTLDGLATMRVFRFTRASSL